MNADNRSHHHQHIHGIGYASLLNGTVICHAWNVYVVAHSRSRLLIIQELNVEFTLGAVLHVHAASSGCFSTATSLPDFQVSVIESRVAHVLFSWQFVVYHTMVKILPSLVSGNLHE